MLDVELLMPAGDLDKLKIAFAYGADAVYAGVPIFSLRARENDFNLDSLKVGIDYAHSLGKKVYLTMNIYAHNYKAKRFLDSFSKMYDLNPDGFIMSDVGLITEALKLRKDAVIHLSTQANVTNWMAAKFWRDQGVKRIILPRELTIKEIKTFYDKVKGVELEAFVHGSVCIAYSGRCLISNYLNYRDANQGTCTNSCRWNYKMYVEDGSLKENEIKGVNLDEDRENSYIPLKDNFYVSENRRETEKPFRDNLFEIDEDSNGTYLMNSKDLCAIELLDDIVNAGVVSLKVEGRTKSIYYVAMIARAYRRAIDDLLNKKPFNRDNLLEVASTSNRTLMTGFFLNRPKDYGMNYEDGYSSALNYSFAGRVVEHDSNLNVSKIEFKNKVTVGETLEWMTPDVNLSSKLDYIENTKGESVSSAHGGILYKVRPPESLKVDEFTLLRKKIN